MKRARPPTPRLTPIAKRELSWWAPYQAFQQILAVLELVGDWSSSSSRGNRTGCLPQYIRKVYLRTINLNTDLDFSSTDGSTDGAPSRNDCRLCMLETTTIQIAPAVCLRLQPISHPIPARRLLARPTKIVPAAGIALCLPNQRRCPSPVKQNTANGIHVIQND